MIALGLIFMLAIVFGAMALVLTYIDAPAVCSAQEEDR